MSGKYTKNSGKKSTGKDSSNILVGKVLKPKASTSLAKKAKSIASSVLRESDRNSKKTILKKETSPKHSMTDAEWERFSNLKDEDIDTSDIPELDENFWKNAEIVIPKHKKAISLRVDEDMLKWFKEQGKGYQSFMNAILRSYYESHDGKK